MQADSQSGILGGLAAYILVSIASMQSALEGQNLAVMIRWLILIGILVYVARKFPKSEFREHTRSPFKAAVLFWIVFFGCYAFKPGLSHLDINNGLNGVILFMLMHLIISFVLMLIVTFAVRSWTLKH